MINFFLSKKSYDIVVFFRIDKENRQNDQFFSFKISYDIVFFFFRIDKEKKTE